MFKRREGERGGCVGRNENRRTALCNAVQENLVVGFHAIRHLRESLYGYIIVRQSMW